MRASIRATSEMRLISVTSVSKVAILPVLLAEQKRSIGQGSGARVAAGDEQTCPLCHTGVTNCA